MRLVTGSAENLKPQLVMEAFCKYLGSIMNLLRSSTIAWKHI